MAVKYAAGFLFFILLAVTLNDGQTQELEEATPGGEKEETTTQEMDYDEDEDACDEGGIQIFNKIICIFKIIAGLLFGNPDPCCPIELPSFG